MSSHSMTARIAFALLLVLVGFAPAASAVESTFQILLNLDNNVSTGCDVPTLTGTFPGVERILITTVNTGGLSADVTAVEFQSCANPATDTFSPPAPVPPPAGDPLPWPVGFSNGTGGTSVIETFIPLSLAPLGPSGIVRIGVLAFDSGDVLRDELVQAQPTPGQGPPILLQAQASPLNEIPTLSEWGLILLGLALALAAVALLRRRTAAAYLMAVLLLGMAGAAWALVCDLDGTTTSEWGPGTLLATEPTSDAPAGTDIRAFFGFQDSAPDSLVFRIDALLLFNQPPVATDDTATVTEDSGANTIPVLANDSDPESDPFTIGSVTQPANGSVAITNGGADLTYTPNADYCNTPPGTTLDTFTYSLSPGGDTATVTVTVNCVPDNPTAVNDAATVDEDSGANAIDVLANDTDPDGGTKLVTAVQNPSANGGTVLITGGGTGVTYQPAANYCNNPPGGAPDTFTYTITGGSIATVSVTVNCSGDNPVANDDTATVTEDDPATAIPVLTNDTDADGDPFTIASASDPANGTVVLTGGSPGAHTGLTYQPDPNYCNNPPGTTLDTFTYTLNPGGDTATVSVTVNCVDDNPTAVNDSATVNEDSGANTINVQANDTDPDGGTNTITSVTQPANGTVVITNGGADLTYAPNANYCNNPPGGSPDTFTYTLTPGGSSATVSVTVNCADDPPTAVNDVATVNEDSGANTINVQANDVDLDGGTNTITAVQTPSTFGGTVVITNGGLDLTYAPAANYCNTPPGTTLDTFTYTLSPGGSTATVTVTVTCLNDGPAIDLDANDDKGTGGSDFAVTFTEGDAAKLIEDPADATLTDVDSANLTSLTVTITNLLDTGFETLAANTSGTAIIANYTPGTGVLALTGSDTVANYQQVLRTITYQNTDTAPDTSAARVITFVANDGTTNSNTATSTVTVAAVDSDPVAVNDTTTVNEDSTNNPIDVLANDTDPDGGTKLVQSVTQPANGTVAITGGGTGLTYTPNANYCNSVSGTPDTFTYTLSPGGSTATVSVTVTCQDDNPTAVNDTATVNEDSGANTINVQANDTDPDGGTNTITSVTQPTNGTVVITNGGADLTYAPNANYCNSVSGTPDTFTYTLTPGGSTATVSVTVTCVEDNPVAVNDSATVVEDSGANTINVQANDTDADGGTNTITSVTQPANGAVVITNGGADLTYAPNANYCNSPPGTTLDTFTYSLTPGGSTATVTVTVTCVNDPPVANPDAANITEEAPNVAAANTVSGNVLTNDTDPDNALTVSAVNGSGASVGNPVAGTYGSVTINSNGSFTYSLDDTNPMVNALAPGQMLTDTFNYTASDGALTSSSMLTVTIHGADDPPTPDNEAFDFIGNTQLEVDRDTASTPEVIENTGGPPELGVLEGDVDPDGGGAITISGIVGCADLTAPFDCVLAGQGTVSLQADGSFSFIPEPGDADPTASFQYTLAGNPSNPGTVTLTRFERVWFVDPNAGGGGNGTSSSPFNSLDPLDGVGGAGDSDVVSDYIFIHDGTLALSGPMPMEGNQHLIGQGHVAVPGFSLSIPVNLNGNGSPTNLVPTGTRPQVSNAIADPNDDAVTIGNAIPIEIVGLSLASTNGNAIDLTSTAAALTGSGTLAIGNNEFRTAGAEGIDVNLIVGTTGTLALNITNNSWDTASTQTGNAVDINRAGGTLNLNFSSNTNVKSNAAAVLINGGAVANTTITGFSNNTVHQNTLGAGVAISNVTFDAVAGGGVQQVDGDSLIIGVPGDGVGGAGMQLTTVQGNLFFDNLDIFGGTSGLTVSGTGSGMTLSVTPAPPDGGGTSVIQANGPAVDVTSATIDLRLDDMDSSTTGTGVSLNTVAGQFKTDSDASISKTSGSGTAFSVATSSATVTYGGTLNVTSGGGVSLTSNTGSMSFSGGMTLSTGANAGFSATGGGTVTVTDPPGLANNTITTTTGTALTITNTTIGGSDVTFEKISAGTSGSPANGIVLNNTGSSGELIVTGNGGSCTSAATCTGGAIQSTTGDGISLTSTRAPSLTRMFISGSGAHCINATTVNTGLTLASSYATNCGNADNEYGLNISNLTGTATISGTTFDNAADDLIHFVNTNTNGNLTVNSSSSFIYPASISASANAAIAIQPNGTSNVTATVQSSTFTNIKSDSIQWGAATAGSNGTSTLNFSNNTITVNTAGRASGYSLSCQESTTGNITIANNNFSGAGGNGVISIDCNDSSLLTGSVSSNTITNPPGIGMFVAVDEAAEARLTLNGNTVTNSGGDGIQVVNFGGVGISELYLALTNNQVNGHSANTSVNFVGGISVTSFEDNSCIQLTGNAVTGTPASPTQCGGAPCVDYYIEEVGGTMTFEEVPNTANTTLNAAYVNSTNDAGPVTIFGTIDLTNGAQCPFP